MNRQIQITVDDSLPEPAEWVVAARERCDRLEEACRVAVDALASVVWDDQVQEAGLFKGPMIPRTIARLTAACGDPPHPLETPIYTSMFRR